MKKLVSIVVVVAMCLALSLTAFAAEVDLAAIGGKQEYNPHGYPDAYGVMLGYGNKVALGEYNLADYEAVVITYATDLGFIAEQDSMPCSAFFAICDAEVNVGYADSGIQNEANILAKADAEDAYIANEAGVNWGKGERTVTIDLTDVSYNGNVWLSHYNSTGNEALVVGIEFVEAGAGTDTDIDTDTDTDAGKEPEQNAPTGDVNVVFAVVAAALVLTVICKKKIFA